MKRAVVLPIVALLVMISSTLSAAEVITLKTEDGITLKGDYYLPASRPAPGIILLHMMRRSRAEWTPLATALQAQGYAVLAIDLRGHGQSTAGRGTTLSWEKMTARDFRAMVQDVRAAWNYLLRQEGQLDRQRLALIGASIGANLALSFAATTKAVKTVVLLSPGLEYRGITTTGPMRQFGKRPALIVSAEGDQYAWQSARRLAKLARGEVVLKGYPGRAHGTDLLTTHPALTDLITEWLVKKLKGSAGSRSVVRCGATLTADAVLDGDLRCKRHGLIIAADGITLDLGGHTMVGPGRGPWTWPDPGLSSVGIRLQGRRQVTIRNGHIRDFASAVLVQNATDNHLDRLTVSHSLFGLYLSQSHHNTINASTATDNIYGFHLTSSNDNHLTGSTSRENRYNSPGGYGFYLYDSHRNLVQGNTVEANANWGLWISHSQQNLFFHNNVVGNRPNGFDDTGDNHWYDRERKQGNFWSDYKGTDSNQDGIGEIPYPLEGGGGAKDLYPYVRRSGWVK